MLMEFLQPVRVASSARSLCASLYTLDVEHATERHTFSVILIPRRDVERLWPREIGGKK